MDLQFNQSALRGIQDEAGMRAFVGAVGQDVADRANARAAQLFTDRGGGGVGSITSSVEDDDRGIYARVGYPPEHWYMTLHEVGTEHERPRPHLRPALFSTRKASGGQESSIRRIRQDKRAQQTTKRNREAAKARRDAKKGRGSRGG